MRKNDLMWISSESSASAIYLQLLTIELSLLRFSTRLKNEIELVDPAQYDIQILTITK